MITGCKEDTQVTSVQQQIGQGYEVHRAKEFETENIEKVYVAKNTELNKNKIIQIVHSEGYKDIIEIMVIIDLDNEKIEDIKITKHHESKDYGGYVTKEWFTNGFKNKSINKSLKIAKMMSKDSSDIIAITGATVTSKAVVDGVNLCLENIKTMEGKK